MDTQTYGQLIFDKAGKNIQWNEGSLFSKWCWEDKTATCRRMKLDHFLKPHTKINSKWMKDLNVRQETIKTLEEKIGNNLFDLAWLQQLLTRHVSRGKGNKSKNKLLGPHQDKNFCTAKETINNTKRQLMEWEKIFAIDISDKVLVSKIYIDLIKLNTQKPNNLVKKWAEDIQMAIRHMKRCSTFTHHQGNTTHNHNDTPPHTCQNG